MPSTIILLLLYVLSLVAAVIGFSKKLSGLKLLAALLFVVALVLTLLLGFALNRM